MKVWINDFHTPLEDWEGEASFGPPGAFSLFLLSAVSANHVQCFQKQKISFDFIENEFKPGGPCGLQVLDDCQGMLNFTFDLKTENTWLPKKEKVFCLISKRLMQAAVKGEIKKIPEFQIRKT